MYENKSRKELIATLKSINNELFEIKEENEQLKAQLNFNLNNNENIAIDELRMKVIQELSNIEKQKKVYASIINEIRILRAELLQSLKDITNLTIKMKDMIKSS